MDFFISYTAADRPWAEWIASTLERAGCSTIIQVWDFRPGENFVARMNAALAADRVVAVLSTAYFHSQYATDEWTAALVRQPDQADILLPVRVLDCVLPPLLANRIYIDLVGLSEPEATAQLIAGVKPGRARPATEPSFPGGASHPRSSEAARFPGDPPAVFNAPPRNPNFTGRDELLSRLYDLVRQPEDPTAQPIVVHGTGGIGKSQVATEYAHRFASEYDVVWWVHADQGAAIAGQLAGLARHLDLPELPRLEDQVASVFGALGKRDRWLLIYDNAAEADDLDDVRPPRGGGHVLITSRNPVWGGVGTTIGLSVLDRDEALAFLLQRTENTSPAVLDQLTEALGNLPLGLEQAAAYLEETHTTAEDYVELLRTRAAELLSLGKPSNYRQTIATTWSLSLRAVREQTDSAEDLLHLCSFLAADSVPRAMLTTHPDVLPQRLRAAIDDRIDYQRAVGVLARYSLITVTVDTVSMHRLLQVVVRAGLDQNGAAQWARAAVRLVQAAFPMAPEQVDSWPACDLLLSHALATTAMAMVADAEPEATADLLDRAGRYLRGRADYPRARQLFERSLTILERTGGSADLSIAQILNDLGVTLYDLRELGPARAAHERALNIRARILGPRDADTARSLTNLGAVLRVDGSLGEARSLHNRAVKILDAQLGSEHPDTAQSINNLALVQRAQREFTGARASHERALAIRETVLGPDHPDTASSLSNLALVLTDQGDRRGAQLLHQRALQIREERLGPNHPLTARSLNNVANAMRHQGDLAGAQRLHSRALQIREARLGVDHIHTARSAVSLGNVMRDQGDLEAARRLFERALSIREVRLGRENPDTVRARLLLQDVTTRMSRHKPASSS